MISEGSVGFNHLHLPNDYIQSNVSSSAVCLHDIHLNSTRKHLISVLQMKPNKIKVQAGNKQVLIIPCNCQLKTILNKRDLLQLPLISDGTTKGKIDPKLEESQEKVE